MNTMKLKHSEEVRCHHSIIIAPSGDYNFPSATIEVRFVQYDDDGMLVYNPFVRVFFPSNISQPENVKLWGECLVIASQIATRQMPTYIDLEYKDEIINAWMAVEAVCEANGLVMS